MVQSNADATTEAVSAHLSRSEGETWFGHPRQLARLFSVELWERFGFYGMRALLVLYLTSHFLFPDRAANGLYGGYMSLVYLTPMVGGWLADRYLGSKRSVKFGALVMAVGYFLLCFGGQTATPYIVIDGQRHGVTTRQVDHANRQFIDGATSPLMIRGEPDGSIQLIGDDGHVARTVQASAFEAGAERSSLFVSVMLIGLSLVAVGNGFFKPNISTIVGALYAEGDRRRDAGFTIFYMGINLGSIGSQTLCPLMVAWFGWWAGFLTISIGMVIAYGLMHFAGERLAGYGDPPPEIKKDRAPLIFILSLLAVPLFWLVFRNVMIMPEAETGSGFAGYLLALPMLGKIMFIAFLAAVIGIPVWSWRSGTRAEAQMMLAAIILIVFNVAFWTIVEQAGSSLTLFADRNTSLELWGMPVSAGQTQNFNSITIVLFAPVVSIAWGILARRGLEPSIPIKFGLALIGAGLSFLLLAWSGHFAGSDFRISLWWLLLSYFIASIAELLISPVGLSMITKLSMARVVGMMMGVWFVSFSIAEYLAGAIAQAASVQTVGGQVTNPELSLHTYLSSFQTGGLWTVCIGIVLLALSPVLKRLMHGVR